MKTFQQFKEAAIAVPLIGAGAKTLLKVGGAVLAAKGGEKILKDLLGTPDRPKRTDWDKNPKDKIDQELNVRQGQVRDRAKYKKFDDKVQAVRKAKEAGNLDAEQLKNLLGDAAKDRPKSGQGNKGRKPKK